MNSKLPYFRKFLDQAIELLDKYTEARHAVNAVLDSSTLDQKAKQKYYSALMREIPKELERREAYLQREQAMIYELFKKRWEEETGEDFDPHETEKTTENANSREEEKPIDISQFEIR